MMMMPREKFEVEREETRPLLILFSRHPAQHFCEVEDTLLGVFPLFNGVTSMLELALSVSLPHHHGVLDDI